MNGHMGFRDHNDAADTERAELMEVGTDDGGFGNLGTGNQDFFHSLNVVEEFGVAPIELQQQVPP